MLCELFVFLCSENAVLLFVVVSHRLCSIDMHGGILHGRRHCENGMQPRLSSSLLRKLVDTFPSVSRVPSTGSDATSGPSSLTVGRFCCDNHNNQCLTKVCDGFASLQLLHYLLLLLLY